MPGIQNRPPWDDYRSGRDILTMPPTFAPSSGIKCSVTSAADLVVRSSRMTAATPSGIRAPVRIRKVFPGSNFAGIAWPAAALPMMLKDSGARSRRSSACRPKPSTAELSKRGRETAEVTSAEATLPSSEPDGQRLIATDFRDVMKDNFAGGRRIQQRHVNEAVVHRPYGREFRSSIHLAPRSIGIARAPTDGALVVLKWSIP